MKKYYVKVGTSRPLVMGGKFSVCRNCIFWVPEVA